MVVASVVGIVRRPKGLLSLALLIGLASLFVVEHLGDGEQPLAVTASVAPLASTSPTISKLERSPVTKPSPDYPRRPSSAARPQESKHTPISPADKARALNQLYKRKTVPDGALRSLHCDKCVIAGGRIVRNDDGAACALLPVSTVSGSARTALCESEEGTERFHNLTEPEARRLAREVMEFKGAGKALDKGTELAVNRFVAGSCFWKELDNHGKRSAAPDHNRWAGWDALRLAATPRVQELVDCLPKHPPPATCHHLPRFDKDYAAITASASTRIQNVSSLSADAANPSASISTRPLRTLSKLKSSQKLKGSWLQLENVCVGQESDRQWFMPEGLDSYATVYTLDHELDKLVSAGRKGRHRIFKEREGGFQYGGVLSTALSSRIGNSQETVVPWIKGTAFLLTPFTIDNVGHILHDGVWAFAAALLGRGENKLPQPFTTWIPDQVLNESVVNRFYSFLTLSAALAAMEDGLGVGSSITQHRDVAVGRNEKGTVLRYPMKPEELQYLLDKEGAGNGGRQQLLTGRNGRPILCFESLVLTGSDQTGKNTGSFVASRTTVSQFLRLAVHRQLGMQPSASNEELQLHKAVPSTATRRGAQPRIYVYGRNDVYRRSVDNIGRLISEAQSVAARLGLEPPVLISTFYMSAEGQILLLSYIDILLTMQGAHEQTSLFMPEDSAIIEIAPCTSRRTSFVARYGKFLPNQLYEQIEVCRPMINLSDEDRKSQNVTLCSEDLDLIKSALERAVRHVQRRRGLAPPPH